MPHRRPLLRVVCALLKMEGRRWDGYHVIACRTRNLMMFEKNSRHFSLLVSMLANNNSNELNRGFC